MLPSDAVDRIPVLPAALSALHCEAVNLDPATGMSLEELFTAAEAAQTAAVQQQVMAGMGGMKGPISDTQRAAIEAASDQSLARCGDDGFAGLSDLQAIETRVAAEMQAVQDSFAAAIRACPKPGGFMDENCARAARAAHRPKVTPVMARYLQAAGPVMAKASASIKQCALRREKVAADLKASKVSGPFAMMGLQYPVYSWQLIAALLADRKQLCSEIARYSAQFNEP